jgi:hypothetical protein
MRGRHECPSPDNKFLLVLLLVDVLGKVADLINAIRGR